MIRINKKVAVFGDTHFPFHDKAVLAKALVIVKDFDPDMVIQVGDLYDMFSYSKYAHSVNVATPKEELTEARKGAEKFWSDISKIAPDARKVQLTGNHDERITKLVLNQSPKYEHIAGEYLTRLMTFPGVETIHDSTQEFIYDGVCYMHGFRQFGDHARYNQMNTVTGHLHRAGLCFDENLNGSFFEMNVGWLGDKKSHAFGYRSQKRITKTTTGLGLIDRMGPRFVPL